MLNIDEIKEELLKAIALNDEDYVFLSGSLIQGIGNSKSDLDVFVIKKEFHSLNDIEEIVYNNDDVKTTFVTVQGVNCDIEYWPEAVVESLLKQVKALNFEDLSIRTNNQIDIVGYSLDDVTSLLHRFIVSKPIFNQQSYFQARNRLDQAKFCKFMSRKLINSIDNDYDDILGNLEISQFETAYIIAHDALFKAVQAFLFSKQRTLDKKKWTYILLNSLALEDPEAAFILKRVNQLLFHCSNMDRQEIGKQAERLLEFINFIIDGIGQKGEF
ncbi:hypothetical protein H1230_23115 [Paenibacillus sp. 19GGS1-52]|uniref:hypothetical protein n=1 Tax=Paenibacillus sp. 19GGS1-52 TaxID=2758563 RepID=UPI001EFBEB25|nr:hypothetical protein [Paenibacillus sp. 19GGS1-52]ULO05920.1 hypothetical protein H1230_23115 [Paenibacillus sp. 19GGS1-52]